jgi:hypothetical protein
MLVMVPQLGNLGAAQRTRTSSASFVLGQVPRLTTKSIVSLGAATCMLYEHSTKTRANSIYASRTLNQACQYERS